jgi:hypothetical protein
MLRGIRQIIPRLIAETERMRLAIIVSDGKETHTYHIRTEGGEYPVYLMTIGNDSDGIRREFTSLYEVYKWIATETYAMYT